MYRACEMTPSFQVRKLAPEDLALFRDLQRLFADAFADPTSYLARPPSDAYVRRWLASPTNIALVAVAIHVHVFENGAMRELTEEELASLRRSDARVTRASGSRALTSTTRSSRESRAGTTGCSRSAGGRDG